MPSTSDNRKRLLLTRLLAPLSDPDLNNKSAQAGAAVSEIIAFWNGDLAIMAAEGEQLLAEFRRLATLCRELLDSVTFNPADKARLLGKANAYEHAVELTVALCAGGSPAQRILQSQSERQTFRAGWAARGTGYAGMTNGCERAFDAFVRWPSAFGEIPEGQHAELLGALRDGTPVKEDGPRGQGSAAEHRQPAP